VNTIVNDPTTQFKKIGKQILCGLLEAQVKRLRRHHTFKIVAVAGSVGKTSTKLAIADTLKSAYRVIYQSGNYNDRLTVPLVLFGQTEPGIFNVFAWLKLLIANEKRLREPYPYDLAILELGTDGPGQLKRFAYLHPDVVVLTAIEPEHMEYFQTLAAVAAEELVPLAWSGQALLNIDDIAPHYLPKSPFVGYGFGNAAYRIVKRNAISLNGQAVALTLADGQTVTLKSPMLGEQGAKITLAAVAVADMLGLSIATISAAVAKLEPVPGRMQVLPGIQGSLLIDDTYNSSPVAVLAALDVLYAAEATQRIAILGSMNEMGVDSPAMHKQVGAYCDPAKLDLVITIGAMAAASLAPAAEACGCQVVSFDNPLLAGRYVAKHLKNGAIVLAKGSQDGVFAEEALMPLLAKASDQTKLVRQSPYWRHRKAQQLAILKK
jgi:UDP-N-acetylmuramoyl-tripeptide--D-alanyl-D-alanine ligase